MEHSYQRNSISHFVWLADKIISLGTDVSNHKNSFFNIKNVIYCIKRMLKKKGKPEDEKIYKWI